MPTTQTAAAEAYDRIRRQIRDAGGIIAIAATLALIAHLLVG